MFCRKCGIAFSEGSQFCDRCGAAIGTQPGSAAVDATLPNQPARTSGKAIGSLITGIFGLPFFPFAITAVILGHMSRSEIRKSNGRLQGAGTALAGLSLGYVGASLIPVIIIAAIAIPNLLRARISANESSAVSSLRKINTAQISYISTYPKVGYAPTLARLGSSRCGPSDQSFPCPINARLASGQESGYRFEIRNWVHSGQGNNKYQLVAYPLTSNQTGLRAFCSDESDVIKFDPNGSPDDCLAHGSELP
jgi:type IV pilus assembly protein PilA